jgi:hypothetical protein
MPSPDTNVVQNDVIDFRDVTRRLNRGLAQILAFTLLGVVCASAVYFMAAPAQPLTTRARIIFSFKGLDHGQYPDQSNFQPDDIRAPEIIQAALAREQIDANSDLQAEVRSALTVEGIISPDIIKERDRLRAAGQTPPLYIPDEFNIYLTLRNDFPMNSHQRERLLDGIVDAYRDRFNRTYADLPSSFGNAFETLKGADYFEYELILNEEMSSITSYLERQVVAANSFRSRTTNLSFNDLLERTRLFTQIRLNETLGLIHENGLTMNRQLALTKMGFYLQNLSEQEKAAEADQQVIQKLLNDSENRTQNYVLGIKSQASQTRPESPILDQGLIDSLLANDAYNFLVHQALDSGLRLEKIRNEKATLEERIKNMKAFAIAAETTKVGDIAQLQQSLETLKTAYKTLVAEIQRTTLDFAGQQYSNSVRLSMQAKTDSFYMKLIFVMGLGGVIGLAFGMSLSLFGFVINSGPK